MVSFITKVKSGLNLIPQPDAFTCQSACIAMATKRDDTVMQVRKELLSHGTPGDPHVMGIILEREAPGKYEFIQNASLFQMRDWIKAGEFLITHGYFTRSGHVICINGVDEDVYGRGAVKFRVLDPWSEFNARSWAYDLGSVGYKGFYSSYLIYATCVASSSYSQAEGIYRRGELNSNLKGAWVHRIKP